MRVNEAKRVDRRQIEESAERATGDGGSGWCLVGRETAKSLDSGAANKLDEYFITDDDRSGGPDGSTSTAVRRCIPYKYCVVSEESGSKQKRVVQVLMINSPSGPGLLFPKGGWENDEEMEEAARREALEEADVHGDIMKLVGYYNFQSKTHQDKKVNPEGLCKAVIFALLVKEELDSWPEQSMRQREWLPVSESAKQCRHAWMEEALQEFQVWHEENES